MRCIPISHHQTVVVRRLAAKPGPGMFLGVRLRNSESETGKGMNPGVTSAPPPKSLS